MSLIKIRSADISIKNTGNFMQNDDRYYALSLHDDKITINELKIEVQKMGLIV